MAGMDTEKEPAMPTVLITGIEPFDGESLNPSWEAAHRRDGQEVAGARLVARQLPCVIGKVVGVLRQAIEDVQPDLVICLGQAGGRSDVTVERVAINVVDARIPDNDGRQPIDEPVVEGGPAAYFSSLPIKAIVRDLRAGGVPASVSLTAGTYNCNTIFYGLAHFIATERPALRGGFVHVPYLPEMATRHPGAPSLALDVLVQGVKIMVATSLAVPQDIKPGRLCAGRRDVPASAGIGGRPGLSRGGRRRRPGADPAGGLSAELVRMAPGHAAFSPAFSRVRGGPAWAGGFGQATGWLRYAHRRRAAARLVPHHGPDALCTGGPRHRRLDRVPVCSALRRRGRAGGAAGRQYPRGDVETCHRAWAQQLEELAFPVQQRAGPARSLAGRPRAHPDRMVLFAQDRQ
ncbi:hypothetical protein G6F57_013375 [Rhizopus arrhizus]|nr:hypothetical protein G6F57_013375 [Rhizopus arrhizus]